MPGGLNGPLPQNLGPLLDSVGTMPAEDLLGKQGAQKFEGVLMSELWLALGLCCGQGHGALSSTSKVPRIKTQGLEEGGYLLG